MQVIVQIWDAQNQEVTRRVRATSRRIASKVAEVLHDTSSPSVKSSALSMCGFVPFHGILCAEADCFEAATPMSALVKSRHLQCKTACPFYPRKATCAVQTGMS